VNQDKSVHGPSSTPSAHRKEIHRLKQLLQTTLEWNFFKVPSKNRGSRQRNSGSGEMASTTRSRSDVLQGSLSTSVVSMVLVSRRGFTGR